MKKGLTLAFALLAMAFAMAQKSQDPVLFEIGGEQIRQSEFMKEFMRSIGKDPAAAPTACTYEKRKALEDYVQLFVNYRTKLHDAYAIGMDTAAALRKELASYRNELAAPYLIDSATMALLVDEAYQRNHYAVHAAHILLPLKASASPDDTLRIYNEALSVYNRVTTGKENFFSVAREIMDKKLSPEEKERMGQVAPGHEGDLGFFTVFDMMKSEITKRIATRMNVTGIAPPSARVMEESRIIANTMPLAPSSATLGKKIMFTSAVAMAVASMTKAMLDVPYFSSSIGPRISRYIMLFNRWFQSTWPSTWVTHRSQVSGLIRDAL